MSLSGGPLVSAVIPAFNARRFIDEAIESVLTQTYSAIECIVVDDGSTDGLSHHLGRFGTDITLVRTPNRGVSAARNEGVRAASGDIIAFLDSDDRWLPEKTSLQVEILRENLEVGLVYSGMHMIDELGRFIGRVDAPEPAMAVRNTLLLEPPVISVAQTGLMPREVFEAVGGFDERLSTSADCDFAVRVGLRFPLARTDLPLALYRKYPGQMHLDPIRTETDMRLLYDKVFSSKELLTSLGAMKRRAYANLFVSLAGKYRMLGERRRFVGYLTKALVTRPDRVVAGAVRLTNPTKV